jgi:hypothetical protein
LIVFKTLTQHALSRDNDLLGLFFNGERSYKRSNFFGRFPLRQLSETFLTSPDTRMNDLEEELTGARVEDEDSTI